jgi:hypothetical protein
MMLSAQSAQFYHRIFTADGKSAKADYGGTNSLSIIVQMPLSEAWTCCHFVADPISGISQREKSLRR